MELSNSFIDCSRLLKSETMHSTQTITEIGRCLWAEGLVVMKSAFSDRLEFEQFVSARVRKVYSDAPRRGNMGSIDSKPVDPGNDSIPFHSEASFLAQWPSHLWFYCEEASEAVFSLVADGAAVWASLSPKTRDRFSRYPLTYNVALPVLKKIKRDPEPYCETGSPLFDTVLDWPSGLYKFKINRMAVNHEAGRACFSNHVLIDSRFEPSLKSVELNGAPVDIVTMQEVSDACERNKNKILLSPGDCIVLNNKRWMHGREEFNSDVIRRIRLMQTSSPFLL